jgi:hypothetical protein
MIDQEQLYARISDAPWANFKGRITLGGLGGLGSHVALMLSRVGHHLTMFDMDTVGGENIGGGQMYGPAQIGMQKTDATLQNIRQYSGHSPHRTFGRFEAGAPVSDICIATFDNMEARKWMFDSWTKRVKQLKKEAREGEPKRLFLFINISMLPEGGFIEVVDRPSRAKRWQEEWVPSGDIPDLLCTFKATTHNAMMMAGRGVSLMNNSIFNHILGEELRPVPYKTIEDLVVQTLNNYD